MTWGFKGIFNRALELPDGDSSEVSPPGRARLRYSGAGDALEVSLNGAPYVAIPTGSGSSPWTRVGTTIRPVIVTDQVAVGAAAVVGGERMRVVGDVRVDSTVFVSALNTSAGDLAVGSASGRVNVTVSGVTADAFNVSDASGRLIATDLSSGRNVVFGQPGAAVDSVQMVTTRTDIQVGTDASAFDLHDATDSYASVDTTGGSETIVLGNNTKVLSGITLDGASMTLEAPDNSATATRLAEGANVYLGLDTTDGSESLTLGNSLSDVSVTVKDNSSQAFTVQEGGNNLLSADTTNGAESITFGNTTTNPDIFFDTDGDVVMGPALCLAELAADPPAVANTVKIYGKESAGVTQLFARADDGTVYQLTPLSGGSPGGADTNVQYNNAGSFGGDADFVYDGAGLVQVGVGLTVIGLGGPLALGTTVANEVDIGSALTDVAVSIKDNSPTAFAVSEAANDYVAVDTTDGAEVITFGNAGIAPAFTFVGTGDVTFGTVAKIFGADGDTAIGAVTMSGTERLRVVGDARVEGKLTVTGSVDPTDVQLSDPALGTALFFASADGQTAPVSGAAEGRIRYNDATGTWQISTQTSAYADIATGAAATPGGANTNVQYNNAGAFGGDASFTYNGAGLVSVSSGLTRTAAGALNIGTTVATSINYGSTLTTHSIKIKDNVDPGFEIVQGANNWFGIQTTNGSEGIQFGANAFDPYYFFAGGTSSVTLTVSSGGVGRINVTTIGALTSASETAHNLSIGTAAGTNTITVGRSGQNTVLAAGDVQVTNGPISFTEQAGDPGGVANKGRVYTKDVAAVTELFYEDSASNVVQITSGGSVNASASPAGADTQVQYNNAGSFGANAAFTFASATGSVSITGGLNLGTGSGAAAGYIEMSGNLNLGVAGNIDKPAGGSLGIGANATSLSIAAAGITTTVQGPLSCSSNFSCGNSAGSTFDYNGPTGAGHFWVNLSDNQSTAFLIYQASPEYMRISTSNGAETMTLGAPAGINMALNIGHSTITLGFFGTTATGQYSTTGTTTGFSAGVGTVVNDVSTFTGNTGATAYTIGDVVRALKLYGLMAA